METKVCTSCKKKVVNDKGSVNFSCPNCEKMEIVRCTTCKRNGTVYTCAGCGFKGPN